MGLLNKLPIECEAALSARLGREAHAFKMPLVFILLLIGVVGVGGGKKATAGLEARGTRSEIYPLLRTG